MPFKIGAVKVRVWKKIKFNSISSILIEKSKLTFIFMRKNLLIFDISYV